MKRYWTYIMSNKSRKNDRNNSQVFRSGWCLAEETAMDGAMS